MGTLALSITYLLNEAAMSKMRDWTIEACTRLGLAVESDFVWIAHDGIEVRPMLRIPAIGSKNGMLIFSTHGDIETYEDELVKEGYGYTVIGEPGEQEEFDIQSYEEMFADWGWSPPRHSETS